MRCEGDDIEALERQRPIQFGGVVLPELLRFRTQLVAELPTDKVSEPSQPRPGPLGESTREGRLVAVSRWAFAAKVKQGVPMVDLLEHFGAILLAEEALSSE